MCGVKILHLERNVGGMIYLISQPHIFEIVSLLLHKEYLYFFTDVTRIYSHSP